MIYLVKDTERTGVLDRFTQHTAALEFARHLSELRGTYAVYEGDVESPTWLVYAGTIYVKQTTKK